MEQETLMKAMNLQKQSQEAENSLRIIDEQAKDLQDFSDGLDFLEKNGGEEMISSMGKGVHLKTKLMDNKLYVEVGGGVLVRKTPAETRAVIVEQIKRFGQAKVQLMGQMENYQMELKEMIDSIEKMKEKTQKTDK